MLALEPTGKPWPNRGMRRSLLPVALVIAPVGCGEERERGSPPAASPVASIAPTISATPTPTPSASPALRERRRSRARPPRTGLVRELYALHGNSRLNRFH